MKKGEVSRQKLVDATAALLRRQGFHATGLSQIVAESGAPRGSLYFYFPDGKEELAAEALAAAGAEWRARLDAVISTAASPGEAIEAVCRVLADDLAASGYESGCPLATVALEAPASSTRVRETIARHYDGWRDVIVARMTALGVDRRAAAPIATFVLAAIEGALLLAKVEQSKRPILQTGSILRALIEGGGFGAKAATARP